MDCKADGWMHRLQGKKVDEQLSRGVDRQPGRVVDGQPS